LFRLLERAGESGLQNNVNFACQSAGQLTTRLTLAVE